jgi:PKD repeat protein
MRRASIRLLLTTCLATVAGAVVSPLGTGSALAHPTANFEWTPTPVIAGEQVTFTSTSTKSSHEPFAEIVQAEWNIDGRWTRTGNEVTVTAPAPGLWTVRLRVRDAINEEDEVRKVISVEQPPAPPPPPPPTPPPPTPAPTPPPPTPPPTPPSPTPPPPTPPPAPPSPAPANESPTSVIAVLPASPVVGEEVTFISYSDDPDGRIIEHAWDLNGDGSFDEGTGAVVTRRFSTPGDRQVALRVTDDKGSSTRVFRTITVRVPPAISPAPAPSTASEPRLLSPFPVVRLVGSAMSGGARIRMLAVRAPRGARALVRCTGSDCPVKRVEKIAGGSRVRFRAFEEWLDAGVVLEVFVRRGDRIGKYTRFEIRSYGVPKRADGCLRPGTLRRTACPRA